MSQDIDIEKIQRHLGTGKFQIFSFILLGLVYSRGSWHVFGIMFLAGDPGHKCAVPEGNNVNLLGNSVQPQVVDTNASLNSISFDKSITTLPTLLDVSPQSFFVTHDHSIDLLRSNLTAESCVMTFVTMEKDGNITTEKRECPNGWSYGSEYETTILSEVQ